MVQSDTGITGDFKEQWTEQLMKRYRLWTLQQADITKSSEELKFTVTVEEPV